MANIASYISNLGKSIGYSAIDTVKKMNPALDEFKENNNELFKTAYSNIVNYRTTYMRTMDTFKKSKVYEAEQVLHDSLFEDIKNGTFYNKKRAQDSSRLLGNMDMDIGDFGDDSTSGIDDFDVDGGWDDSDIDEPTESENAAQAVSMATAKSAEYVVENAKANTNLLYIQNTKAFDMIGRGMDNINKNVANLAPVVTTIQTQAENQIKFFQDMGEQMRNLTEMVSAINSRMNPKDTKKERKHRNNFSDIVGSEGTVNIREYLNMIKENVANESGPLSSMVSVFGDDSNMLAELASQPLKMIPDFIVNKAIPNTIKKSSEELNKSISGLFGSIVAKLNTMASNEDNILQQYIGKTFGVRNKLQRKIDTSNFQKGRVDWSSTSENTLNVVIPTYLRKILSVLDGKDEMVYDNDRRRFVDGNNIKDSFDNITKSAASSASMDIKDEMMKNANAITFNNKKDRDRLEKNITKVLQSVFESGTLFDANKKNKDAHMQYGITERDMDIIRALFRNTKKSTQLKFNTLVAEGRDSVTSQMQKYEDEGSSLYSNLFNGSNVNSNIYRNKKGKIIQSKSNSYLRSPLNIKDDLGHSAFYYLQNIYKELKWTRESGGYGPEPDISGNRNSIRQTSGLTRRRLTSNGYEYYSGPESINDIRIKDASGKEAETNRKYQSDERYNKNYLETEKKRQEKYSYIKDISDVDDEKVASAVDSAIVNMRIRENVDKQISKKQSFFDKFYDDIMKSQTIGEAGKKIAEVSGNLFKKPFQFVEKTMNKVNDRMYAFIYGTKDENGKEIKGVLQSLNDSIKSTFTSTKQWLEDNIFVPIKDKLGIEKFSDLKDKFLEFTGLDAIRDTVKERFKDFGGRVKDSVKNTFSNAWGNVKDSVGRVTQPLRDKFASKNRYSNLDELEDMDFENRSAFITDREREIERENAIRSHKEGFKQQAHGKIAYDMARANMKVHAQLQSQYDALEDQLYQVDPMDVEKQTSITQQMNELLDQMSSYDKDKKIVERNDKRADKLLDQYAVIKSLDEKIGSLDKDDPERKILLMERSKLTSSNYVEKDPIKVIEDELKIATEKKKKTEAKINTLLDSYLHPDEELDKLNNRKKYLENMLEDPGKYIEDYVANHAGENNLSDEELRGKARDAYNSANARYQDTKEKMAGFNKNRAMIGRHLQKYQNLYALQANKEKKLLNNKTELENKDREDLDINTRLKMQQSENEKAMQDAEKYTNKEVGTSAARIPKGIHAAKSAALDGIKNIQINAVKFLSKIFDDIHGIADKLGVGITRNHMTRTRGLSTRRSGFDPNESRAADDFSLGLARVISDYMHNGGTSFFAEGTQGTLNNATVSVVGKGEAVLTADSVEKIKEIFGNIINGTNSRIVKGKKLSKTANTAFSKTKDLISGLSPDKLGEYLPVLGEMIDNEKYEGLDDTQKAKSKAIMHKVLTDAQMSDEDIKDADKNNKTGFGSQVLGELGNGASAASEALFGRNGEEEKKHFVGIVNDVTKNISDYVPDAIGGALLGGGVSLVTGAIGGPLLGAAVGAGVSLAKKSTAIQNWLFGDVDEDGERMDNGLLSKDFLEKAKKVLPDMKAFGITGGVAGLVPFMPFGPITGLMLGGTVGFLHSNEEFKKSLFGDSEGLIDKEMKDKLKKTLPKMGAGALVSTMLGPFGILGNAALGAGLGYLSTTETFKDIVLGKKDAKGQYQGGLLSGIRNHVITPLKNNTKKLIYGVGKFVRKEMLDPLRKAFNPLVQQLENIGDSIKDKIGNAIKDTFEKHLGTPLKKLGNTILNPFKKAFGWIGKKLFGIGKFVISSPFKAIGGVGELLRRRQIKNGTAKYMTAEERVKYRDSHATWNLLGRDSHSKLDKTLMDITQNDPEAISKLKDSLDFMTMSDKKLDKTRKKKLTELGNDDFLSNIGYLRSKKIQEMTDAGDIEGVKKYIAKWRNRKNIDPEKADAYLKKLDDYKKYTVDRGSKKDIINDMKTQFAKYGFDDVDFNDPRQVKNLQKYLATEVDSVNKKKSANPDKIVSPEEQYQKNVIDKFDTLIKILRGDKDVINGVDEKRAEADKEKATTKTENGKKYNLNPETNEWDLDESDPLTRRVMRMEEKKHKQEVIENADKKAHGTDERDSKGMLYKKDGNGELVPDMNDKETRRAINSQKSLKQRIMESTLGTKQERVDLESGESSYDLGWLGKTLNFLGKERHLAKFSTNYETEYSTQTELDKIKAGVYNKKKKSISEAKAVQDFKDKAEKEGTNAAINAVPQYAEGSKGELSKSQVAVVGKGEVVVPAEDVQKAKEVLSTMAGESGKKKKTGMLSRIKNNLFGTRDNGLSEGQVKNENKPGKLAQFRAKQTEDKEEDSDEVGFIGKLKTAFLGDGSKKDKETKKKGILGKLFGVGGLILGGIKKKFSGLFGGASGLVSGLAGKLGLKGGGALGLISKIPFAGPIALGIGGAVALANAPKIKEFITGTALPWIENKAVPWIRDKAIPAIGNGVKVLVKALPDIIIGGGKFIIKNIIPIAWDLIKSLANGIVEGIKDILPWNKSDKSSSSSMQYDAKSELTGISAKAGKAIDRQGDYNSSMDYNISYSASSSNGGSSKPKKVTAKDEKKQVTKAILRNVATGGATGSIAKTAERGSKALNKLGKVSENIKHPFKSRYNRLLDKAVEAGNIGDEEKLAKYGVKIQKLNKRLDVIDAIKHPFTTAKKALKGEDIITGANREIDATTKLSRFNAKIGKGATKIGKGIDFVADKVKNSRIHKLDMKGSEKVVEIGKNGVEHLKNIGSRIGSKASVAKGLIKNTKIGSKLAETAEKGKGKIAGIIEELKVFIKKLLTNDKVVRIIGEDKAAKLAEKLGGSFLKAIEEQLVKRIAKISAKMAAAVSSAGILNIIMAVGDFISGYRDAKNILGITEEPTFGMKVGCGILKAFTGLFFVLSIIPEKLWVDLVMDYVLPIFGKDDTKLQKLRESANKEVEKYNKKHRTDYSVEDYNKKVKDKGKKGLFSTIGDGIKKGGKKIASLGKKLGKSMKKFFTAKGGPDEKAQQEFMESDNLGLDGTTDQIDYYLGKGGPTSQFYKDNDEAEVDEELDKAMKDDKSSYTGIGGKKKKKKKLSDDDDDDDSESSKKETNNLLTDFFSGLQNSFEGALSSIFGIGGPTEKYKGMGGPYTGIGGSSQQEFIDKIVKGAQEGYKAYGVFPSVTLAQAALESGWGSSRLANADNNLFGIKYPGNHDKSLNISQGTWATDDGGYYTHYKSWADSVKDHGAFLASNSIYKNAGVFSAKTPEDQIKAIKKAGYATDPNYVQAVTSTMNANNLKQYDTGTYTGSGSTTSTDGSDSSDNSSPTLSDFFSSLGDAFNSSVSTLLGFKDDGSTDGGSIDSSSSSNGNSSGKQADTAVRIAKSYLGSPYVWGGTTPPQRLASNRWVNGGFDCSGLVQYAYKQAGINLDRTTYDQVKQGKKVNDMSKAKAGDLVFFGDKIAPDPDHVGIYLGNGEFIHAPKTGDVVKISKLENRPDFLQVRNVTTDGSGGPNPKFFTGMGGIAGKYFSTALHGNVTSGFGHRNTTGNIPKDHTGIDIGAKMGSKITTPIGGVVTKNIPASKSSGFGNVVAVKDKNNAEHYFGHMENKSNVKVGSKVNPGDSLGKVGSTGNSTGPHLHYEVRKNGKAVNPDKYLTNYGGPNPNSKTSDNSDLLNKVITLLTTIATNTTQLSTIVELINKVLSLKSGNKSGTEKSNIRQKAIQNAKDVTKNKNNSSSSNDKQVQELVQLLTTIAAE